MATVHVEPAGIDIDVQPGESVAEAAWRQGYTWPTRCWGQAECMACFVRVLDGEMHTEPAGEGELFEMRTKLPKYLRDPFTRLACRLQVTGEGVVLEKKGVLPPRFPDDHSP